MTLNELKVIGLQIGDFLDVVREGFFESLGFVTHRNPKQFVFIENARYLQALQGNNNITCVLTKEELVSLIPANLGLAICETPRKTFYEIHNYLARNSDFYWKTFNTEIAGNAVIHPTAFIAPRNVRIGEGCIIGPRVCILEGAIIEENVVIGPGSIIASEGFEFNRLGKSILPVAHAGGILLHARVEIQANVCVDKAIFGGFTEIGEDTKLDNLIHIAHNVLIGKRCLVAACAMVAGSTTIGDDVWVGPSASISSEVCIGDNASITIGSVVTKNVPSGQRVTGNFALEHDRFITFLKTIR